MSNDGGLPSSYQESKRAKILELAAAGDKTNPEIAKITHTSPNYVAKVKSESRVGSGRRPPSRLSVPLTLPAPRHPSPSIGSSRSNLKDTAESADERKKLWKEFSDGKSLATIIQETGLNPQAVELEHNVYLKFTGRDPHALQRQALDYLASRASLVQDQKELLESIQNLVSEYNNTGYLTNDGFSRLLQIVHATGFEAGIDAVAKTNNRAPKGWTRPPCSVCGKPISSVVFDPAPKMGNAIIDALKGWKHAGCGKKS